jgi:hypothetical protein
LGHKDKATRREYLRRKNLSDPEWRQRNYTRTRTWQLKQFGMTDEDYDKLVRFQDNKCFICRQPETARYKGNIRILSVDHCHLCGLVRALLCDRCNRVLGLIEDDLSILLSMQDYLIQHSHD